MQRMFHGLVLLFGQLFPPLVNHDPCGVLKLKNDQRRVESFPQRRPQRLDNRTHPNYRDKR